MQRAGTPHRELFRAAIIQETVAIACTCSRGVDHWYAEPIKLTIVDDAEQRSPEAGPPRARPAGSLTARSPRR